jgi:hypothetical protein
VPARQQRSAHGSRGPLIATFAGRGALNQQPRQPPSTEWTAVSASSRTLLALPLALAALIAGAPAAGAAWTAPQAITGPNAVGAHGAGNSLGSEAFSWQVVTKHMLHLPTQTGFGSYVRARIRLPGGRLGHAQTISSTSEIVAHPQIGVADGGDAWAVWAQAGRHIRIMAAFRPRGQGFGSPFEVGRSSHFYDASPTIVVGRFGDVAIVWNAGRDIRVVRRAGNARCEPRRALACFKPSVSLAAGSDHAVALGPLGSAYVVWAAFERTANNDVHTRLRMAVIRRSNRQGPQQTISSAADGDASQPSIAVRPDGTAEIAWRASLPAGGEQNESAPILAAASSPDAVTSPPQVISTHRGEQPVIGVDPRGEAILAWDQFNATPQNVEAQEIAVAVRAAAASPFGAATALSPANAVPARASLAIDAAGTAYVAYYSYNGLPGIPIGLSHVRPEGGAFGAPIALPASLRAVSLLSAGAKVSAFGGGGGSSGARVLVSDWTP